MKRLFFCVYLSLIYPIPIFSSTEGVHFSLSTMVKKWLEEDNGATWPCRVCHYSNWKKSPPYTCANCSTEMGKG